MKLKYVAGQFHDFLNWKKYPANVFYLAGPVAVLAFSLHGTVAVLKAREGDYGYAAILTPLMLVLCAFLCQARKTYMVTQETIKRSRERDAEKEEQHVS